MLLLSPKTILFNHKAAVQAVTWFDVPDNMTDNSSLTLQTSHAARFCLQKAYIFTEAGSSG